MPGTGKDEGDFPVKGYDSEVVSPAGLVGVRGWVYWFFPIREEGCQLKEELVGVRGFPGIRRPVVTIIVVTLQGWEEVHNSAKSCLCQ